MSPRNGCLSFLDEYWWKSYPKARTSQYSNTLALNMYISTSMTVLIHGNTRNMLI